MAGRVKAFLSRVPGLALFLPVPLVLWLFTRAPLGERASLAVGVALMLSHRFYARPWALARARHRCLWCGRTLDTPGDEPVALAVNEPTGATEWTTCARHADRMRRVLRWAARRPRFLRATILGSVVCFLAWASLSAAGRAGARYEDAVALFRLGVAAAVLPLGWLGPRPVAAESAPHGAPERTPFPLHIQALVGTSAVLWLFRVVGLVWLVLGVSHLVERAGLHGP